MKTLTKILLATTISAAFVTGTSYKNVIHNIMSHHPGMYTSGNHDTDFKEFLQDLPKMSTTRGWYKGVPRGNTCQAGIDMNAIYLGKEENPFPLAKHRPISATILPETPVYDPSCLIDSRLQPQITASSLDHITLDLLKRIYAMKPGEVIPLPEEGNQDDRYYWHYGEGFLNMQKVEPLEGFGNFTLSIGRDAQGRYVSFYDIFDFTPGKGGFATEDDGYATRIGIAILPNVGTPIHFYKRWYFNELGITDYALKEKLDQKQAEYSSFSSH